MSLLLTSEQTTAHYHVLPQLLHFTKGGNLGGCGCCSCMTSEVYIVFRLYNTCLSAEVCCRCSFQPLALLQMAFSKRVLTLFMTWDAENIVKIRPLKEVIVRKTCCWHILSGGGRWMKGVMGWCAICYIRHAAAAAIYFFSNFHPLQWMRVHNYSTTSCVQKKDNCRE